MRFLSFFSGLCLFVGLTLVLFVGGLVVYETCFGEPLFDYGVLPGADKEPAAAAKASARPAAAPGQGEDAKESAQGAEAAPGEKAPAPLQLAVPSFSLNAAWELRGDVRVTLRPRLRGLVPRSFPAYVAAVPGLSVDGPDPYLMECPTRGLRSEQAQEFLDGKAELSAGDVQWVALGACRRLPALKGEVRLFYPEAPLEVAWENPRAGNGKTQEREGMRFTLRNRQLNEQRYQFVVEFSLPAAPFPGQCFTKSARAFLRSHGKPCPVLSPFNGSCRRRGDRLEGSVEFMLEAPQQDAEVVFRGFPRMTEEKRDCVQPPLPLPPLPGGRRLEPPASEEPPVKCMVEGSRLVATGLSLNCECFTDGRPNGKVRGTLQLRWDLGQRSAVVSSQGEAKARVGVAPGTAEARVRYMRQARERDGRRLFFQVEWEEDLPARPRETGTRRIEGVLPPVQEATDWKFVDFVVERNAEGRPMVPREQDGIKLVRANENPDRWCNYAFEASPEIIPESVFPLVFAACEITPTPAPARQAWLNVRRNGQKTVISVNFQRVGDALTQKVALRWPSASKEITARFFLPNVPMPERRAPMRRELF